MDPCGTPQEIFSMSESLFQCLQEISFQKDMI